ncbi:MAG: hypothetical protein KF688_19455 [Pirellulales bacterium]|nr:hypothetical protein [Pirellulales bacterium]MBX3433240.1 hypothetical protein [Pirellulales bacterium]
MNVRFALFGVLAAISLAIGCAPQGPPIVPVSGRVLLDGKPLTHGIVRFAPPNQRPALGRLDGEGRFTLTTRSDGDGAIVGTHRVAVQSHEPTSNPPGVKWHAPQKYANYSSSGLTQEILGPTADLVINLSRNGPEPR